MTRRRYLRFQKLYFTLVILFVLIAGCDELVQEISRTVTVDVVGDGTVSTSPQLPVYVVGSSIVLEATPFEGWVFDHWEGDFEGTDSIVAVIVVDDISINAVFVPAETYWFTVSVEVVGSGTVNILPDQDVFDENTDIVIDATPSDQQFEK